VADTVLRIQADVENALRGIQRIESSLGRLNDSAAQVQRSMSGLTNTMRTLAGAVIGASLFNFVDDLQNMQNKLLLATNSQEDFNNALGVVKQIADKTGQSLSAIGNLYAAVSRNAQDLGYNQAQITTVTNAMATALKVSGASAQGSASVMYQFSQILAKGKVNGDEFTTIMENLGGPVMNVVAKNMGVTTAQLLKMKEQGLIGAKDFTDALIRSMNELDKMGGKAIPTLSQNLTKVQNEFGMLVINLDKATGFSGGLASAMSALAKNVDVVAVALVTMFGLLVVGNILAAAAAIRKLAVEMGLLNAVLQTIGKSPVMLVISALVAAGTYFAGKKLFGEADKQADALATATADANARLEEQQKILQGIQLKYAEITKELDAQLAISKLPLEQQKLESELLQYKKQLQGFMTADMEKQLRLTLRQIDLNKAALGVQEQLRQISKDIEISQTFGEIKQAQIRAHESVRRQYGQQIADTYKSQLDSQIRTQIIAGEIAKISREQVSIEDELTNFKIMQAKYGSAVANDYQKAYDIQLRLGETLSQEVQIQIQKTEELKRQLEFYKQMAGAVEAVNRPLVGPAAGAMAAQQLGQLDPVKAAQTQNQSILNGLKELYSQGLITEQQYQIARVSAEVQANDAIMSARQKMFETQKQYELQNQQLSVFGYETQKAMAAEAAKFQMKSDMEKYQFALDQAGQMFSALGAQNRKAFEAAKAFNIANAVMNTYMAATKALATYPWPFGMVAAGAAVAMGLAQVAQIRSQQYSGRALGGPVMGGKGYIVGENGPELFTPNTTGSITRNGDLGGGGPVNVTFNIMANDTAGFDDLLLSRRGLIRSVISDAMLESGRRG
jgi:tape measure domain-containing protein